MKKHQAKIEKVLWQDIRKQAAKVNPVLSKIIDGLDIDEDFFLFKAYYPFGSKIINHGVLQLPTPQGDVVACNDSRIPEIFKNNLKRRSIPASLVLKNTDYNGFCGLLTH